MSMMVTRTCEYDGGCDQSESFEVDHDGRVVTEDGDTGIITDMPMEVVGSILWCHYEPEKHPKGQTLCREHERQIREERGIRLFA